jgi:hypothetical protein
MDTGKRHPALSISSLLFAGLILAALLPARGLAQQPESPDPAGQYAPDGEGPQRRMFRGNGVIGKIESLAPGEMKVSTPDGTAVTVHLSAKTAFRLDQQAAKQDDFKAGMMVFVRGTKSADGSWEAETVSSRTGPPGAGRGPGANFRFNVIAGSVKAIEGRKITLLGQDNTTETVELDENTSLRRRRESITLADIHPGDAVIIRGDKKDGAFVPVSVTVVDAEQLQRMLQFAGAGGPPPGANPPGGASAAPAPAAPTPPSGTKPPRELR